MKTPLPQAKGGRVLADQITAILQEAIVNGYFEPGEKIDQDLIARELEVSRTPVREALTRLQSDGFIDIRPHRGAFIARVTRQDIRETYELRRLLEAELVRQVTPVIPESTLDELEESAQQLQAQFNAGDISSHYEYDVHFHATIVDLAENSLLKETLDSLTHRISMVRRFGQLRAGQHLIDSHNEHRAILKAMRQRDPERAAELMKLHLERSSLRVEVLAD
jgi:DNA-binding GntR family transcriptional regulator